MALSSDWSSRRSKFMSSLLNIQPRESLHMGRMLVSKSRGEKRFRKWREKKILSKFLWSYRTWDEFRHVDITENRGGTLSTLLSAGHHEGSVAVWQEKTTHTHRQIHILLRDYTHVLQWSLSCQRIWDLCWHRGEELRTSPSVWQPGCEALRQCKLHTHTHTHTQEPHTDACNNEKRGEMSIKCCNQRKINNLPGFLSNVHFISVLFLSLLFLLIQLCFLTKHHEVITHHWPAALAWQLP